MVEQTPIDRSSVRFDAAGLVPCVVQEWRTGEVLMVAWMNGEALDRTLETQTTWFWSRSRETLWNKGETSGNYQRVRRVQVDCDGDTLLVLVEQLGPACHTGTATCFTGRTIAGFERPDGTGEAAARAHEGRYVGGEAGEPPFLTVAGLFEVIEQRKVEPVANSYTARLFSQGLEKIGGKVREEAGELVEAAGEGDREHTLYEAGDLAYHLLVLLSYMGLTPQELWEELERRRG